ncbi:hypothetical protein [Novosphingobium album (ex Hu et al. 2023)]|uniref:Uncharacterized protein n=1 Tax=Novosphingobium album (ex Hu et al. 2023) TaxID=2930093 RepID=A0ABT0B1C5_9SPHN|nr:hypothetical protein [Novosphingobium album (ex Hu et al. 2023)]MCJ2178589.1 hypothetical protein [Novosphingobium album (ex Hu et al. 2023)]
MTKNTGTALNAALMAGLCLLLASCGSSEAPNDAASEPSVTESAVAVVFPDSLVVIGDGYPESGAPCRRLGESAVTSNWLDDSAILVGCPSKSDADALGGTIAGAVGAITIVSVPTGDANEGLPETAPMASPVAAVAPARLKDPIRSPGGMETKCLARVNEMTGGGVIGTRRIDEAESGVMIYVNVQGAEAPWQCFGSKDGKLAEVYYGGDEGAL